MTADPWWKRRDDYLTTRLQAQGLRARRKRTYKPKPSLEERCAELKSRQKPLSERKLKQLAEAREKRWPKTETIENA